MTIQTELHTLLTKLKDGTANFNDVLNFIDNHYITQAVSFKNGKLINGSHENQASARVLSLAKIFALSEEETLSLYAEHYQSVLADPKGKGHENIRNFMEYGWDGITLNKLAIIPKYSNQ